MRRVWMILLLVAATAGCAKAVDSTSDEGEPPEGENSMQALIEQLEFSTTAKPLESQATFNASLSNQSDKDVTISFRSGQKAEMIVTNQQGEEVFKSSEGKMFTQAVEEETIPPNDIWEMEEQWDYTNKEGNEVTPGTYQLETTLLVDTLNGQSLEAKPFVETITFVIPDNDKVLRDVTINGSNGNYTVTGTIQDNDAALHYSVEDGHNLIIEKTEVKQKEVQKNGSFSYKVDITIPKADIPKNGTLTVVFTIESSAGEPIRKSFKLESFS
ncbi:BsuPI-related putative proteinase inhibitor [Pontibacillus salicampi]|uniref:Intracellular proteinase inhibitor BsuPI domain-containing protein n=1 Tax=Pontibacillus salicampi TaxID=1449801 RepID=A0ABV6LR82_9BACI